MDDFAQRLRAATGAAEDLRISVVAEGDTAPLHHEFKYPYVVIGRGEGCDILLQDPKVSFRHAYFQVIEGRVFCVDLASRNGVHWPDGPRKYGWVKPGEPMRIGRYTLQVLADSASAGSFDEKLGDLNPLEQYGGQIGQLPKVDLEFRHDGADQPVWTVNRLLTLIGRGPVCKLRFETPMVSAVHCGLLLTRHGLWAIDLMGRGGTKVDGQNVRAVPLESGSEITFGNLQIAVFYQEGRDVAAPDRLTDNAAESETSMDSFESPPLPDDRASKSANASSGALDWTGTLFRIEGEGDTLIVMPLLEGHGFRYQQLHVEANALQRKFEMHLFVNLIIDLQHLNYFGSELIGALIRLARMVTDDKGRAAFCAPSPRMREVFEGMRLSKLWPIFDSRAAALKYVKE